MADKRTRWIIEATSNIPDINKQLERLIQLQQTQNDLTQQNTTSTALAIQRQREQIEQLSAAQSKANQTTQTGGKLQTDMIGTLRKEYDLLSKSLSGIAQLAAGAWAVSQLKTYVDEIIRAKSSQDGFVASMEQMLGSRLKAEELNAKLIQIALKSPFETEQLQEVTKKLQGMGVETQKIIPYINMLGDIAAIVGTQKLPLIAKALTDVQSKHVLMAQEIKQFTDNGVPLYDLLAKSMQKPVEEIRKLASEHKLVFEDVEKALMQATQKGGIYYGQMTAQSKQLGGMVANLGDMYTLAQAKLGDFYEKGIKGGIKAMGEFITETIGSENAINRTITALKAGLAMWVSYRTAIISIEAAQRANNASSLASLGAIEAQKVATVGLSVSTAGLSAAFNGLRVAFMSNPFGFVATAITSLIGLFYTFKAANIEVAEAQSIEAEALRKTNQEVTNAIERVKGLTVGTQERKKATEELLAKYPELFKSLDSESIGNAQLETALKRVNAQYREKIQLAIIDAKNNNLLEQQIDLETRRYEIVKKLREENSAISLKFEDDSQFIAELNRRLGAVQSGIQQVSSTGMVLGGGNMSDGGVTQQMILNAQTLERETKKVQESITKNANEQSSIRLKIDAEENNQKLTALRRQLRNNEISIAEFNTLAEKIGKESVEKQVKHVEDGEDKKKKAKKETVELSLENDLKELKSMEQTFAVKMAILHKEEDLKIEQAKRQLTNASDKNERILSIEKEFQIKRNKLAMEYSAELLADIKKGFDERIKAQMDLDKKIAASQLKLSEEVKANLKEENKAWKDHNSEVEKLDNELLNQLSQNQEKRKEIEVMYNAEILEGERKFWQDKELFQQESLIRASEANLESLRSERDQWQQRADIYKDSVLEQDKYKEAILQVAILTGKVTEAEAENFQKHEDLSQKKIEKLKELAGFVQAAVFKLEDIDAENFLAGLDRATEAVHRFYDATAQANKDSFQQQVAVAGQSLDEINQLFEVYAQKQRDILSNTQAFDDYTAQMKKMVADAKEMAEETATFTNLLGEGKWVAAIISGITSIIGGFKKAKEEKHNMQMEQLENDRQAIELELQLNQDLLDAKIANYEADYAKFKERMDEKEARLRAYYEQQTAAETQYYQDSETRAIYDDEFRKQLLAEGEAREIKALQDARDRQVKAAQERGATAEEVAGIVNAFELAIKDKHNEYLTAQGDKDAAIALAKEENKNQEADAIQAVQNSLQAALDNIRDLEYNAELAMYQAILNAKAAAAQQEMAINSALWEANKQAALTELDFQIKKEKSKGNPNGNAIIQMVIAYDQISGSSNPYGAGVGAGGIGGGSIPRTYNASGGRPGTPRGSYQGGDAGGGRGPTTNPRGGFNGSTWLKRKEWEPYGVDQINMQTHEGERLMPVYLNQFLGEKVSNQELVHGYLQYANFKDRLPDIAVPLNPSLQLPDFSLMSKNAVSMDRVEQKLDELNKTFASKSLINVNIDGNAVSISEQWASHKANYYDTLFKG